MVPKHFRLGLAMQNNHIIHANTAVIKDGTVLNDVYIEIVNGKISRLAASKDASCAKPTIEAEFVCAGFVDIHNHGLGGADSVIEHWFSDYSLERLPHYGTTSVIASLTMPKALHSTNLKVVEAINQKMASPRPTNARIRGIHCEGPIIQTCGGLPPSHTDMTLEEFQQLVADVPNMKLMTISPNLEKQTGYKRIRHLLEKGILPCIGHDADCSEDAILDCLQIANEFGKRLHITHLFNASTFHHRNMKLCNFGMLRDFPKLKEYEGLRPPTVEIIGDFVHVHPLALKLTIDSKGYKDIAIITDAIIDAVEKGEKSYAGKTIEVKQIAAPRCAAVIKGSTTIAGSCTTQLEMFSNLTTAMGATPEQAVTMLSEVPAKIAGCIDKVGTLEVGKQADVLIFDYKFALKSVIIEGTIVI